MHRYKKDFTQWLEAAATIAGGVSLGYLGTYVLGDLRSMFSRGASSKEAAKVVKREIAKKPKKETTPAVKTDKQKAALAIRDGLNRASTGDAPSAFELDKLIGYAREHGFSEVSQLQKLKKQGSSGVKKPAPKRESNRAAPKKTGTCKPGQNPKRDGCTKKKSLNYQAKDFDMWVAAAAGFLFAGGLDAVANLGAHTIHKLRSWYNRGASPKEAAKEVKKEIKPKPSNGIDPKLQPEVNRRVAMNRMQQRASGTCKVGQNPERDGCQAAKNLGSIQTKDLHEWIVMAWDLLMDQAPEKIAGWTAQLTEKLHSWYYRGATPEQAAAQVSKDIKSQAQKDRVLIHRIKRLWA